MALKRQYGFWISVVFLFFLFFIAIFGNLLVPHDPYGLLFRPIQPPSWQNLLGTDNLGRDVLSRIILGSRISVIVGIVSVFFSSMIGIVIGLIAAYFRRLEAFLMRTIDALWSIPTVLLALSLAITMKPGLLSVVIVIGIVYAPIFTRLVFGQAVSIREKTYVEAAHAIGCPSYRVLSRYIFPNLVAPLIVQGTLAAGTAIVLESTMSFLGVGIQPPTPSWGVMIRTGYTWLERAPWMALAPGLAIYFTVVTLNLIGDKLRIRLDPKQRARGL